MHIVALTAGSWEPPGKASGWKPCTTSKNIESDTAISIIEQKNCCNDLVKCCHQKRLHYLSLFFGRYIIKDISKVVLMFDIKSFSFLCTGHDLVLLCFKSLMLDNTTLSLSTCPSVLTICLCPEWFPWWEQKFPLWTRAREMEIRMERAKERTEKKKS